MKDRLVFWGKKNGKEKVLLTIDLDEDEGTYEVQVMKAENVTEAFDNLVRNQWRNGSEDVVFPEIEETFTRELSLTADLLPDEYEVDRRSEEHTSELQSRGHLVCRLLLEKKNRTICGL